jgi:hypothetical protein
MASSLKRGFLHLVKHTVNRVSFVETEELEAPLTGGGDAHSCVFAETLVSASSLILEPAVPPTK